MTQSGHDTLADLKPGQERLVLTVSGNTSLRRRLSSMGMVRGTKVSLSHTAPLGNPRTYQVFDYILSLRNEEASLISLQPVE